MIAVDLKRSAIFAFLVFIMAGPPCDFSAFAAAGNPDKVAAQGSVGKPLIKVGDKTMSREQFERKLEDDFAKRHGMKISDPGKVVTDSVEETVRLLLVANEIEKSHKDDPQYVNLRKYLEDSVVGNHYLRKILPQTVSVTKAEIEEVAPRYWKELKIRQITASSWEKAEEIRKQLESGADFIALVREESIDPAKMNDGLHVGRIDETTPQFFREDIDHLFSLEKGQISRVIPTKMGFAVCRVEEVYPVSEEDKQARLAAIESSLLRQKVAMVLSSLRKNIVEKELDEKEFTRICGEYLGGKVERENDIVFKTADRELPLGTVVYVADLVPGSAKGTDISNRISRYYRKAVYLTDLTVGANLARRSGYEMSGQDRSRLDAFVLDQMADYHYRRIVAGIKVTREDARKFFEENPSMFYGKGSVELYDIQVGTKASADKVRKRVLAGEKFESLAKKFSIDQGTAKQGGYLGIVPIEKLDPEVEKAVAALGDGKVSGVISSNTGFHIVKVVKKIKPEPYPFEERAGQIVEKYRNIMVSRHVENYLRDLKNQYPVEVDWNAVKSIIEKKKGPK